MVDDVPQVVDLCERVFPGRRATSRHELEAYFVELFFQNPWRDSALPSLVYRGERDRVSGFLGVIPRRFAFGGRDIRAAVSTGFMVDREGRGRLAGIELLKQFLSGPQDLSLSDGANDVSRALWEALGGATALLYSVYWIRVLRPTRYALDLLARRRRWITRLNEVMAPWCGLVDAVVARLPPNRFHLRRRRLPGDGLEADRLVDCIGKFSNRKSLVPAYDARSVEWLFQMAAPFRGDSRLRKAVVRSVEGEIVGWWLYYLAPGGVGQLLQVGASLDAVEQVLHDVLADAWRQGAIALRGRVEPAYLRELGEHHCLFKGGPWMLVHARDRALIEAIHRGDAFLSRLDGEGWIRLVDLAPRGNGRRDLSERLAARGLGIVPEATE